MRAVLAVCILLNTCSHADQAVARCSKECASVLFTELQYTSPHQVSKSVAVRRSHELNQHPTAATLWSNSAVPASQCKPRPASVLPTSPPPCLAYRMPGGSFLQSSSHRCPSSEHRSNRPISELGSGNICNKLVRPMHALPSPHQRLRFQAALLSQRLGACSGTDSSMRGHVHRRAGKPRSPHPGRPADDDRALLNRLDRRGACDLLVPAPPPHAPHTRLRPPQTPHSSC